MEKIMSLEMVKIWIMEEGFLGMNYKHSGCGLCQNHWAQVAGRSPLFSSSLAQLQPSASAYTDQAQQKPEGKWASVCKDETWGTEQSWAGQRNQQRIIRTHFHPSLLWAVSWSGFGWRRTMGDIYQGMYHMDWASCNCGSYLKFLYRCCFCIRGWSQQSRQWGQR